MGTRGWLFVTACGVGLALTAGCAKNVQSPEALSAYSVETGDAAPDYIVETPDSIRIEVVDDQSGISRGAQLRPDGKITMPLLGDVSVTGLTPLEIKEKLSKLYAKYLKQIDMTVTVTSFASKNVYIFREPGRATVLPYTGNQDFLRTMARAGGPGPNAAQRRLLLVRASEEQPVIVKVNFKEIVREGRLDELHNPTIRDGDIVFVPMDVFSWLGFQINKIMGPVGAALQPVRAWDTWEDVINDE